MRTSPRTIVLLLSSAAALVPAVAQGPARGIPAGTYTTTLRLADVTGRVKEVPADSLVGTWALTFDSAGGYTAQRNGRQVVAGVARPRPGRRVYLEAHETGPYACPTPATYRYTVRGDSLTLQRVRDTCDGRIVVFTSHPHTRAG